MIKAKDVGILVYMRRFVRWLPLVLPLFLLLALGILAASFRAYDRGFNQGCGCDFTQATGDFDASETTAFYNGEVLTAPALVLVEPSLAILGEASGEEKWIEIDLSEQKLIAWQGNEKFLETPISSGKTYTPTPTGEFSIWSKFKYTKMSGGSKENGTYYYLPNVPYTMYFYKGYGLHGTYWHNNFGTPMSHGCVNLPTLAAEKIFYWANPVLPDGKNYVRTGRDNPGTRVLIHD